MIHIHSLPQQKMEKIETEKTEKKVSVFGEQKAWPSLAFVLTSPMCKQNRSIKSWTTQAAPAVMETKKNKRVPESRKQVCRVALSFVRRYVCLENSLILSLSD